ncbi:uncharacterized protein BJ171DRAFT_569028 [Polychytrium aggregatum]|uniref:uncharacterized protein n=1 Tax=Polychytrium aggregatum TaxID=110093 RepID=UPI0022FEE3F8|nr:uncharacterized protein BJ171DRAFT_569028 [Polychytrium aggregatum]KAI9203316.1 hypothetical protein BJ171DRAFT_569028 [Polychytrium aggregatum]
MMWAPNVGVGYPWSTPGAASPTPKSPVDNLVDFSLLDTNRDGTINALDDPYSPFFPGREYVDWVGVSLYYYNYDTSENTIPASTYLQDWIVGQGLELPRSSASPRGATEAQVRQSFWRQSLGSINQFPLLQMVINFEESKTDSGSIAKDWTIANHTLVREALFADLRLPQFGGALGIHRRLAKERHPTPVLRRRLLAETAWTPDTRKAAKEGAPEPRLPCARLHRVTSPAIAKHLAIDGVWREELAEEEERQGGKGQVSKIASPPATASRQARCWPVEPWLEALSERLAAPLAASQQASAGVGNARGTGVSVNGSSCLDSVDFCIGLWIDIRILSNIGLEPAGPGRECLAQRAPSSTERGYAGSAHF